MKKKEIDRKLKLIMSLICEINNIAYSMVDPIPSEDTFRINLYKELLRRESKPLV